MSNPKAKGMQISLGQNVCFFVLIYHEQSLSKGNANKSWPETNSESASKGIPKDQLPQS